jgi:hypothetical protein
MYREDVRCRNCGKSSEQTILTSTNAFGSPDLDLRPPEMQRSTMRIWLQLCPHCGFCAPDLAKTEGDRSVIDSAEYRAVLANQRFPELARRFLARALVLKDADPAGAAHSCLCAAWACDDAGLDALAVECRLGAAIGLEQLKPFEDSDSGLTPGAILVDVLRRAGRFQQAASECEFLLANRSATGVLKQVLEFQRRLIVASDRAIHTVAEATQSA